jgi:hypothetical protein
MVVCILWQILTLFIVRCQPDVLERHKKVAEQNGIIILTVGKTSIIYSLASRLDSVEGYGKFKIYIHFGPLSTASMCQ